MPEWSRVVNTTIAKYVREVEVNVVRNRKLTALMESKGRIKFNVSGNQLDWKVQYKRAPMQGHADADTLTFSRRDRWKSAQLEWRGYAATDAMTKKERLMNKSVEAIVKIYDGIARNLMDDMEEQFCDELYIDGNASNNSKRIHGIESFLGDNGSTAAGDKRAAPSDSFAGLNTDLGNYGGTWTGTWPDGTGDTHYDFWSPLLVNYTSTGFGGTTATWKDQAIKALRYGIIKSQKNKSKRGMLDMILLTSELYRQALDLIGDKERIVVERNAKDSALIKLGFSDVFNLDGVDITWEYGVPDNLGYGFNVDEMELQSLQPQLFVIEGPDFDLASQSYRFSIDFYGNLKANPRHFVKFKNYA
jgi:hypothetical protein